MKKLDLHIHTVSTKRDKPFEFSIEKLKDYVIQEKVDLIAITNHNLFDAQQFSDITNSAFIHQAANELVKNAGTRNIKQIARSCSLDISETSRIKDMLGLLSLYFDKPLILINRQLDKQTKQMVCGYALGHYLEHQLLMDLHTLNKFLTMKDKHILLYEHNAFTSHLMLDSDEVYLMTKRGLDAAQISAAKRIHLNLVLVKLLELHHLGYDLRHYRAQHHAFIKQFNLPAHFKFDVTAG